MSSGPRRSPLHSWHVAHKAAFAEFAGWEMPREYPTGVLAEHQAVRTAVGIFDVSHLGKIIVRGPGAREFANRCLTNDLDRIGPGRAQYTLCCRDDGGIVDDLIVYLRSDDDLLLIPNAANAATVAEILGRDVPDGVQIADRHADFAVLAVQGPASAAVLDAAGLPRPHQYMSFLEAGDGFTVCRTGYTGELGYELVVPSEQAEKIWQRLIEVGERFGITPCGLGARDTLRTEMGYPLHGQDISPEVTPNQARLGWAVGWRKPAFRGRDALLAERERGPSRLLRGLRVTGGGIPRPGMAVVRADDAGEVIGRVTSGTFSPTLRMGIGLALLDPSVAAGDSVAVDIRGRRVPAVVVDPPFVDADPRRDPA
ncbi:MAG: glycine cleavage system aminomethyltransferase GcvT [Acidothermus sp.]|nr:glycine cleavage system aminomethyltransferase GcvT [Acidothermus sp.]